MVDKNNSTLSDEDKREIIKLMEKMDSLGGLIKEPTTVEKIKMGLHKLFRWISLNNSL